MLSLECLVADSVSFISACIGTSAVHPTVIVCLSRFLPVGSLVQICFSTHNFIEFVVLGGGKGFGGSPNQFNLCIRFFTK